MKRENLRSVFVLLFLTVALFFLEYQDTDRYAALFSFDAAAVMDGEVWRVVTYQFTQSGKGWFSFPLPVVLFFSLLLLFIMGSAVEEAWGTRRFLTMFFLSTLATAAAGAILGVVLIGSYFINFSLLFVYAAMFPGQTFYIFAVIPVRIRWIAWVAAVVLVAGVFAGGVANTAALAGAVVSYIYFVAVSLRESKTVAPKKSEEKEPAVDSPAIRNAARFVAVKRALAKQSVPDIDRLTTQFERDTIRGVNICPPSDYKPENTDGYCIRCEGFSECSARFLTMNRPTPRPVADASAVAEPTS
jgi:membrane associated rhomboid family serine protease